MAEIVPLGEAVEGLIGDGDMVAFEGFTHLIPFAAGHEVVRRGRRDLTVVRMTPDLIYDQLIGMGCVGRLVFAWGGNPGVGSLHRLRDAVERGWPRSLELEERTHGDLANAYVAGASDLPFAVLRSHVATDLPRHSDRIRMMRCPFTGLAVAAVPSVRPDVAVIHAQRADRRGNVLMWGIVGVQKEAVMASRRAIVTVEEVVDDLEAWPNAIVLPHWILDAVCPVPKGAFPSYAQGFYERNNPFYLAWDRIARDRETFTGWMRRHVLDTDDMAGFLRVLAESEGPIEGVTP
jgi:glutaconate CoA-transferase, subunit A